MDQEKSVTRIDIVGDLNIFNAAEQRQRLLEAIDACDAVEVDLSLVSDIDSAGLQLMLAAKREAGLRNKELAFSGHSVAVCAVLALCGLSQHLGEALPIGSAP